MTKPRLNKIRIGLAFTVAAFADMLQIPISGVIAMPYLSMMGEFADYGLDMITAAVTILLLGFHPALFPTFLLKAIQSTALMPTWTACVGYVVWSRKSGGAASPPKEGPVKVDEIKTPAESPSQPSAPEPTLQPHPERSGLWILVIGALLIAGVIWVKHKPSRRAPFPIVNTESTMPQIVRSPNAHGKPVVAVAQMEYLAPAHATLSLPRPGGFGGSQSGSRNQGSLNPERVCTILEDMLAQIDGIQLLSRQQMRLLRGQANDKTDDLRNLSLANTIVMLAVLDIHEQRADFKGYGIETKTLETQCSLRVQVMKASDASITFSRILSGSKTETQTEFATTSPTEDRDFEAVKNALRKLEQDSDFKNAVRGATPITQTDENTPR